MHREWSHEDDFRLSTSRRTGLSRCASGPESRRARRARCALDSSLDIGPVFGHWASPSARASTTAGPRSPRRARAWAAAILVRRHLNSRTFRRALRLSASEVSRSARALHAVLTKRHAGRLRPKQEPSHDRSPSNGSRSLEMDESTFPNATSAAAAEHLTARSGSRSISLSSGSAASAGGPILPIEDAAMHRTPSSGWCISALTSGSRPKASGPSISRSSVAPDLLGSSSFRKGRSPGATVGPMAARAHHASRSLLAASNSSCIAGAAQSPRTRRARRARRRRPSSVAAFNSATSGATASGPISRSIFEVIPSPFPVRNVG